MAMNDNIKGMIQAIAKNDIQLAKGYAKCILAEDKTAKNKTFCVEMKQKLSQPGLNLLQLPPQIAKNSICEDVSMTFREDRYYLLEPQRTLYDNIVKKKKVCSQMEAIGIRVYNTTLLYGEPGTGKTEFAKYVAYKMGLPYLYINFSECIDSYMGATAKNIAAVFDFAREHDCVLVIDEIDTIASNRSNTNNSGVDGERNRTTITIMQEFDRLPSNTILIATTNRMDLLDSALLNRFGFIMEFPKLGKEECRMIADKFYQSLGRELPEKLAEIVMETTHCQRDVIKCVTNYLVKEIEENIEETPAPRKEIEVVSDEYENICSRVQNYIIVDSIDEISVGTILEIRKKEYNHTQIRQRPIERTVKTISNNIGYTEYRVVAW